MTATLKRPYMQGATLSLRAVDQPVSSADKIELIQCTITKLIEPFTLSCVMEVEYAKGKAFLKLFDWRYASQLRSDNGIDPFASVHEQALLDLVKSGQASRFLTRLRDEEDFVEPEEGWNTGENEIYLFEESLKMYRAETAAYKRLEGHQGKQVPLLNCQVQLNNPTYKFGDSEIFSIPGLLLEFIDGYTLSDMPVNAPREEWGRICDQAVKTVAILHENDILNEDVRPSNIIVSPIASHNEYRVVMVDFAQCTLRTPEETDEEWGRAKWDQDEEGDVGSVMQKRLRKQFGYDWPFQNSFRYLQWASGEDDD